MLVARKYKGYDLYLLYHYFFHQIMFDYRYKYVSNKLLKRYVIYKYLRQIGKRYGYKVR